MMTFVVEHKYCGYTKRVKGCNVWDALRNNGLDGTVWVVVSVER